MCIRDREITVTSPAKNISAKLKMGNSKSIDIDKNDADAKEWLKACLLYTSRCV